MEHTDPHMATIPPGPPPAPGRGRGWTAPHLVFQTSAEHRRELLQDLLALAVITAADLVLIKSTLDHVLRLQEAASWVAAVGLTAAAVFLAFRHGAQCRITQAEGPTPASTAQVTALTLGWVALGVGLFWLRWNAASFTPAAAQYDGTTAGPTDRQDHTEKLLAVVLATIYLATGVLAWLDGYKLTNRAATALRRAHRALDRINPLVADKTARVTRLAEHQTIHEHDLDTIEAQRLIAHDARRALATELKEHARVQLAANLGDPEATGAVHDRPEDPTTPTPQQQHHPGGPRESAESGLPDPHQPMDPRLT